MAKKAPFFSHDMNARHDPKISAMRGVYGAEGYGWFWMLNELMAESDGYQLDCKSKYAFNAYAMQLQCKADILQKFVSDCIEEFELYATDGITFWSNSLRKRMQYRDAVSEKRAEAANKRWEKKQTDANALNEDANAMQNNANKTKQNETKQKDNTTDDFSGELDTNDLNKVNLAYQRIHLNNGIKAKDWPLLSKLLKDIPADTIISTMEEVHAKKVLDGGEINSFSYYERAIRDRSTGRKRETDRLAFIDNL